MCLDPFLPPYVLKYYLCTVIFIILFITGSLQNVRKFLYYTYMVRYLSIKCDISRKMSFMIEIPLVWSGKEKTTKFVV